MQASLVKDALAMAWWRRRPPPGLIFHSDRGAQGGFNRSSQHLQPEGVYGTTCGMDETVNWQRCDAITWRAIASARSGAAVLAADRDWNHE
jgi:hypothetical protein